MKPTCSFKPFCFLLFVGLLVGCERDGRVESEHAPKPSAEKIKVEEFSFEQLPKDIQLAFESFHATLKSKPLEGGVISTASSFGEIDKSGVFVQKTQHGSISYTAALTRPSLTETKMSSVANSAAVNPYQFDNLVVEKQSNVHIKKHLVRYSPEPRWYVSQPTDQEDYSKYSGDMTLFDDKGNFLTSASLKDGVINKDLVVSKSKTTVSSKNIKTASPRWREGQLSCQSKYV